MRISRHPTPERQEKKDAKEAGLDQASHATLRQRGRKKSDAKEAAGDTTKMHRPPLDEKEAIVNFNNE